MKRVYVTHIYTYAFPRLVVGVEVEEEMKTSKCFIIIYYYYYYYFYLYFIFLISIIIIFGFFLNFFFFLIDLEHLVHDLKQLVLPEISIPVELLFIYQKLILIFIISLVLL